MKNLKRAIMAGWVAILAFSVSSYSRAAEPVGDVVKARIFNEWKIQDAGNRDARRSFVSAKDCVLETRMLTKVLKQAPDRSVQVAFEKLATSNTPGRDPQWKALYIQACEGRRKARLKNLLKATKQIVFTKHYNMGGSHYAYTEGMSDAQQERHFKAGTELGILHLDGLYNKVTTLIKDDNGVIRDPDISYDGKRLLFSWKKSDREDDYHLYEMELATHSTGSVQAKKVRQLTFGLGYADYEGCYLPNGDIIFNSTRCVQTVDCYWTEVSNLYTCDKDGKLMRRLGFDQVHTNYPQVLPDGRVIYTRWDYNDRGQLYTQALFQMNYDGTGQTEYYGNNSWWPTAVAHARGIPGSDKVIAIATGHHCRQMGALLRIDVSQGRQETTGATLVAPLVLNKRDRRYRRVDAYTGFNGHYQYPYPINEKEYVASYSARETGWEGKDYDVVYVNEAAEREVLLHDPKVSCNQPVFLIERKVPSLRPSVVDYRKKTGTYFMQDVYFGPGLKGIPRGTVKKLRVVALEYRAAGVHNNKNSGPAGKDSTVSTPISIGNGSWDVKNVLGEAKVYEDGSALFEVPARTPVYFQCIDTNGYVVQSMRSWSTLMPGEVYSCIGCHESADAVSPMGKDAVMAMKAGAQKLTPFNGLSGGFSYPKMVQPILDKHCIECHNDRTNKKAAAKDAKKAFSLLGATGKTNGGRNWSDSYIAFTRPGGKRWSGVSNEIVNWVSPQSIPPMLPPYHKGAAKSKLPKMLKEGHGKVKMTQQEIDIISCWIDLLVPYCGDYYEANAWDAEGLKKYNTFMEKRKKMEEFEAKNIMDFIKRKK